MVTQRNSSSQKQAVSTFQYRHSPAAPARTFSMLEFFLPELLLGGQNFCHARFLPYQIALPEILPSRTFVCQNFALFECLPWLNFSLQSELLPCQKFFLSELLPCQDFALTEFFSARTIALPEFFYPRTIAFLNECFHSREQTDVNSKKQ